MSSDQIDGLTTIEDVISRKLGKKLSEIDASKLSTLNIILPTSETMSLTETPSIYSQGRRFEFTESYLGVSNLRAYLKFDNNANDSSGYGFDGTLINSPSYVVGRIGDAIDLVSASTQYVDGNHTTLSHAAPASISLWFYPRAVSDRILSRRGGSGDGLRVIITSGSKVQLFWEGGSPTINVGTSNSVVLNSWNFLAIKIASTSITLSLNNIETSQSYTGTLNPTNGYYIGRWYADTTATLDGRVDDIRFYNIVLSTTEISNLYNNGLIGLSSIAREVGRFDFAQFGDTTW